MGTPHPATRLTAVEAALNADQTLTPAYRAFLLKEIKDRLEIGEFGDQTNFTDNAFMTREQPANAAAPEPA